MSLNKKKNFDFFNQKKKKLNLFMFQKIELKKKQKIELSKIFKEENN